MRIVGLTKWSKGKKPFKFFSLEVDRNESWSHIHIRDSTLGTEEGFNSLIVQVSSDTRCSRCENLEDQTPRRIVQKSGVNWNWVFRVKMVVFSAVPVASNN